MERKLRLLLPGGKFKNVSKLRSRHMASVKGKGNASTENKLRFALVRGGLSGWKVNPDLIPGRPDFFFPRSNLAVFVDGCFWHGCPRCGHFPRTNARFWKAKIQRNRERDVSVTRKLKRRGYSVLRLWEHIVQEAPEASVQTISLALKSRKVRRR